MYRELSMKEIQEVSLEILKQIAKLCEQLNLNYFLIYGTLIGAIRHHGYIPWDDDVDIMMPRSDHDKLITYLMSHPLPHLQVFNRETCLEYPYMITRISDDRYVLKMDNEKPYGMGVFIDIYPFDGLGNTEKEAVKYGMKGDRLSSLCYLATRDHYAIENTSSLVRKLIKRPIYLVSKIIGKNIIQKRIEKLSRKYRYDESEYVGCFVWLSGGIKDIFKKEWFCDYEMCQFEDYNFRVPKEYDKILTHIYGNYMELPPEKDRIGHHYYKAYHKQ